MGDLFDDLGAASFSGQQFPIEGYRIRGGQRKHVHSYPKTDGGKPELLGRELYVIDVDGLFDVSLEARYPGNWPDGLATLIRAFEMGITAPLYLPTRGTIDCFAQNWTQSMSAKLRSGERCEISFLENDEDAFEAGALALPSTDLQSLRLTLAELKAMFEADLRPKELSLLEAIDAGMNEIQAVKDQTELAVSVVATRAERVVTLAGGLVSDIASLSDPRTYPLVEATKNVWEACQALADNAKAKQAPVQTYSVLRPMTLPQVAGAIYGDASRGDDILALNFFEDPYAIPPGTIVRYYAEA